MDRSVLVRKVQKNYVVRTASGTKAFLDGLSENTSPFGQRNQTRATQNFALLSPPRKTPSHWIHGKLA